MMLSFSQSTNTKELTSPTVCACHKVKCKKKQKCSCNPGGSTEVGDFTLSLAGRGRQEGPGLEE